MFDFFDRLYNSTDLMPHGDCLVWDTSLLWQHVGSDITTGIAYYIIATALFYFVLKRRDFSYFGVILLFGAFIFSCGTTHFMAAWTIYYPSYWTEGILKTINAVISLATVIVFILVLPKLLRLPHLQETFDKLEDSEARYRMLVEKTSDLITQTDVNGDFTFVNQMSEKYLGLSSSECIGVSAFNFVHADDREMTGKWFSKCIEQKLSTSTFENRQVNLKTDQVFTMLWAANFNYDEGGSFHNCGSIARDISERKNIEAKLHQSEQKYRTVTENVTDVIWIQNMAGDFTFLSPSWEIITGYSIAEGLTMNNRDLLTPDSYTHALAQLKQRLATDTERRGTDYPSFTMELEQIRKDRSIFWSEITAKFLRDEDGKPNSLTGVTRNITERKEAEKALLKGTNLAQKYLDVADVMLVAINSEGNITLINHKGCDLLGITEGKALGKNWFHNFIPKDRQEEVWGVFKKLMAGESEVVRYYQNHVITYAGEELLISFHNSILASEDGTPEGVIFSGKDITGIEREKTEKANLENQLRQAQKMEAVGTLAGGIAHDFNNILSIILGYTDMAKEDAPSGSTYANDLDQVLEAGHRAKDLVRQILSFSRQSQVEKIVMEPQPLIKEALKLLRSSIPTTIEISENISPDCGAIDADPTQLHQILMNLCTNAFHAMEENGGILKVDLQPSDTIPPELQEQATAANQSFIKLSVSDTGQGIGPDIIGKIFDPFYTTKEQGKGTGMGLSIIYGIIKDYGGTITVNSKVGKGTTFHVYLPLSNGETLQETADKEKDLKGTERILFIDDEEILAKMGKDMLERLGYHVTIKKSSIEALEVFQNQPNDFDLIITDQTMPGMTGLDLSRRMLQIRPDIPIILCTGYSTLVNEEVAKAQGIKSFALKPLTQNTTAKLIRQIFDELKSAN